MNFKEEKKERENKIFKNYNNEKETYLKKNVVCLVSSNFNPHPNN